MTSISVDLTSGRRCGGWRRRCLSSLTTRSLRVAYLLVKILPPFPEKLLTSEAIDKLKYIDLAKAKSEVPINKFIISIKQ